MVIFIDFHGSEGSVVLGFIFNGFHRLYMIFGGFVWISWIPGGSGVPGLMFYGFHRFYWILGVFVWISWNPGARGWAGLRHGITTGLDGSRAPIRTLQSWDPHRDWMTR